MSDFSRVIFKPALQLDGPLLVEASAGTGKTYNIQNVFLRLILERGWTIQQILVVTFTNAATRELREQLRRALLECSRGLDMPADDAATAEPNRIRDVLNLVNPDNDPQKTEELKRRIQLALMDYDSAAIFTIHGFCKRVLERYAFECGHDPDAELIPEQSEIIREACRDWWRREVYAGGPNAELFEGFQALNHLVQTRAANPQAILKGARVPNTPAFRKLFEACAKAQTGIASMRGNFRWQPGGRFERVGDTVDVNPIAQVVQEHEAEFSSWMSQNQSREGKSALDGVAWAAYEIITTARALPQSGDAKPFAYHLKTIAGNGVRHLQLATKAQVMESIFADVQQQLQHLSVLTYDSMLANVRAVLQDATSGPILRRLLREEFKAALIDEFQDTDPVQYAIFWDLFSAEKEPTQHPLVFVGDPKQAIYAFRGGDIYTYYQAKQGIEEARRHTLNTNYRSETNLVAAVNEVFLDAPDAYTFLNANVPYPAPLGANDVQAAAELLVNGKRDEFPLKIWQLPERNPDWAPFVAQEIVRLLSDARTTIGGKPIQPGQIAVLVVTHREAQEIQQALLDKGVNAVRQSKGSVFDSPVAPRLALLMRAMLEPGSGRAVRSALASGLLPCPPALVASFHGDASASRPSVATPAHSALSNDSRQLPMRPEEWAEVFRGAGARWEKYSFVEGFQVLVDQLSLFTHVAGHPDGNQRLADLRHLVELIHQAARSQRLGPVATASWFKRQLDGKQRDAADEDDEAKPRIADDNDAVQIMTIFKSKGLQFPIVFVPTLQKLKSAGLRRGARMMKYHVGNQLVLDLDTASGEAKQKATQEQHAENIRLTYVAITRAINRVYLFEAPDKQTANEYAVAHLLARLPPPTDEAGVHHGHVHRRSMPTDLPDGPWTPPPPPNPDELEARPLTTGMDHRFGHASFSALTSHTPAPILTARDMDEATETPPEPDAGDIQPIFQIPGGAKLGECWHEIFELIDFADWPANPAPIRATTEQTLDKYRICPPPAETLPEDKQRLLRARREAVHTMVANTLSVPLSASEDIPAFRLQDITRENRLSEMEFNFSLQNQTERTVSGLAELLRDHWHTQARDESFMADLARHDRKIPLGFMTGFMDLVFQHDGRFYIVDWKSNQLNRREDGFERARLKTEMRAHSYYLQYLIYTVALHGFLAERLNGYDYDTHIGGIFYLFLRGVDGRTNRGVFSDRPSARLIHALSEFLGGAHG